MALFAWPARGSGSLSSATSLERLRDKCLPALWNTLEGYTYARHHTVRVNVKARAQILQPGSMWPRTLRHFPHRDRKELFSTYPWSCIKDKKGEVTTSLVRFHEFSAAGTILCRFLFFLPFLGFF